MVYHINIGSNKGDRSSNLAAGVTLVASLSDTPARCSSVIETPAWGYESENRYLNVGVEISTDISPQSLLKKLKAFEKQLGSGPHRDSDGNYADRIIDMDIICAVDTDLIVDTPELVIPHPRMRERDFVMKPLLELSPEWKFPHNK